MKAEFTLYAPGSIVEDGADFETIDTAEEWVTPFQDDITSAMHACDSPDVVRRWWTQMLRTARYSHPTTKLLKITVLVEEIEDLPTRCE